MLVVFTSVKRANIFSIHYSNVVIIWKLETFTLKSYFFNISEGNFCVLIFFHHSGVNYISATLHELKEASHH
jgi:hypothetical protein